MVQIKDYGGVGIGNEYDLFDDNCCPFKNEDDHLTFDNMVLNRPSKECKVVK